MKRSAALGLTLLLALSGRDVTQPKKVQHAFLITCQTPPHMLTPDMNKQLEAFCGRPQPVLMVSNPRLIS